jgi:hypothetical protein
VWIGHFKEELPAEKEKKKRVGGRREQKLK